MCKVITYPFIRTKIFISYQNNQSFIYIPFPEENICENESERLENIASTFIVFVLIHTIFYENQ